MFLKEVTLINVKQTVRTRSPDLRHAVDRRISADVNFCGQIVSLPTRDEATIRTRARILRMRLIRGSIGFLFIILSHNVVNDHLFKASEVRL